MSQPDPGQDPMAELCAFAAGDEEYLIDLRRVRQIVLPLPVTAVPRAPGFVEGVAHLRGAVVPVVDVRKRLGVAPWADGRRTRFLLVDVGGQPLALIVDAVLEVVRLPRSQIRPATGLTGTAGPHLFLGVCDAAGPRKGTGRLRLLLNVKALLDPSAPDPVPSRHDRAAGEEGGV
jgi:purine-binding chemotaxis protein CheW